MMMRKFYPDGYYITDCILSKKFTNNILQYIKTQTNIPGILNDKEDIWIECEPKLMHQIFDNIYENLDDIAKKKFEYSLNGRNEVNFKYHSIEKEEFPEFTGYTVYHT